MKTLVNKVTWDIFKITLPVSLKFVQFSKTDVCNSCQMVNDLESHNNNVDLFPMEEKYDFTTLYFVNKQIFDEYSTDKIATYLKIKKSFEKEEEDVGHIVYDIRHNDGDYMRGSELDTYPEES